MPISDIRDLSLSDLANALLEQPEALRGLIPPMPPDEVQINWTGSAGSVLMAQTVSFAQMLESDYLRLAGAPLADKVILDYGCGWGRHLRMMRRLSDKLYGCDPWDRSIELCEQYGVDARLAISDYVPRSLPFPEVKFDLIYAFSVFTHLSEKTAKTVLASFATALGPGGLVVLTVRPETYWAYHSQAQSKVDVQKMEDDHSARGFAFTPHDRSPIDGDITYGDTSISLEYVRVHWPDWTVVHSELIPNDPFQRVVWLRPAPRAAK